MADPIRNFFKSTLVGTYSDADTSITIATGDGALLPDPSTDGAFNLTIFEGLQVTGSTTFEIVRVTARSGDVLTVTRGQESTTPLTIGSATHSILMSATKKTFDDINDAIANVDLTTLTNVESITYDNDGNEVFQLPAGTTAQRPNSPQTAFVRWNTDDERIEVYNGTRWAGINLVGFESVSLGVATATVTANDAVAQIASFIGQFGTPASAFSVRQLGDTDVCMRVRRSSDNVEQNIGFTSGGDLDETALTTFVGANDGFVTAWYDQSVDNSTLPAEHGSGATASYSLRKVNSSYTGDAIRVRRASDNTEQDIGFDANGELDTSALDTFVYGATDLPADQGSGATASYSLRKVASAYTGDAIRVRRSSDNTEQDIGFVDGELDTSTLETFCSGTNGFVTTWYDQSGSNNATQATAGSQPQIVSSGTTIKENGKPALDFDGSDDFIEVPSSTDQFKYLHDGTTSFFSGVNTFSSGGNTGGINSLVSNFDGNSSETGFSLRCDDRSGSGLTDAFRCGVGAGVSGTYAVFVSENNVYTPSNNQYITSVRIDADNGTTSDRAVGNVNGGADLDNTVVSGASVSTGNSTSNMRFGAGASNTNNLSGTIQELLFFNTDQSSNRQDIEHNQAVFYDIAIDGKEAFVTTWYDQSGSNNATQSTAGSQPKIYDGTTIKENGKPALNFDGVDAFLSADSLASTFSGDETLFNGFSVTHNPSTPSATSRMYCFANSADNQPILSLGQDAGDGSVLLLDRADNGSAVSLSGSGNLEGSHISSLLREESSHIVIDNGVEIYNNTTNLGVSTFNTFAIGCIDHPPAETQFYEGSMSELLIYDTDQSSKRESIELNQASYYDIGVSIGATQSTASSQPKIVSSGSVIKENSVPALDFDGSDDKMTATLSTITQPIHNFAVFQTTDTNGRIYTAGGGGMNLDVLNGDYLIFAGTVLSTARASGQVIVNALYDGSSSFIAENGTILVTGDAGTGNPDNSLTIGALPDKQELDGVIQELIFYNSDKSADRTDIESNIATYFNITI